MSSSSTPGQPVSRRRALILGAQAAGALAATRFLLNAEHAAARPSRDSSGSSTPGSTPAGGSTPGEQLAPFDSSKPAGPATGLPKRMAWANTADAEFFLALTKGMEAASNERGCEFMTAISGNDPAKNIQQMETFLAKGLGCLMMQPLDLAAQRPVMERALKDGICLEGLITFPTTLQIAASQYNIGFVQGKAAADHVTKNLGGNAEVHYFNLDTVSPQLQLRHQGVKDGLATGGPGIKIVSDMQGTDISVQGGYDMMTTVIQAHPNIKVVLGGDTLVVGAYQALEQSGKLTEDMYLSGVDGDSNALDLVAKGGAYRASIAFAWQLMGYGLGQFGADWIEGKEIPRVMVAAPVLLDSPDAVKTFRDDSANPAETFKDQAKYQKYLPLLGNVSFATKENYWTSEYVPA